MKAIKKFACLLLTMAMILSLGITAFADEGTGTEKNDSITISNAKVGETYKLYKLLDLSVNSETDPNAYSYTVVSAWADFFKAANGENAAGAGYQYVSINDAGYVTAISDAAALAKAAAEWVVAEPTTGKPAATRTVTVETGKNTAVFAGLENGYYLITSTLGTIAMTETTPDKADVTITEKNPENTIVKTVMEDSNSSYGESNDAQIGDTISFKSTVKIVKGTRNVVVHDKMTSGLTYTAGSVAINGLTKGTEYTVNEAPTDGDTFDITFVQSWIDDLDFGTEGYKEYEITYSATLNELAALDVTVDENGSVTSMTPDLNPQTNKTHVSFGDATTSANDTTTTTTHKFSVYKHATGATENLADAVFSLKKNGTVVPLIKLDNNNYRVAKTGETNTTDTFITVTEGDIVIWGVDADSDYTLVETEAPAGYNKLTDPVSVTVGADNATRIDVENKSGTELPSTGGIGTTLFYVIGGLLMLTAVVLLVTKKRMSVAE